MKRHAALEAQFEELTNRQYLDVLSYRLFSETGYDRLTLRTLTKALEDFQVLFTNVYAAIRQGARRRLTSSPEITEATSFEFEYSFPGSAGFVFALPNERLLTNETDLDKTMKIIFEIVETESPDEILNYAHELGVAPIRAMYKWVENHAESGLGADINWRREHENRAQLFAEVPRFESIRTAISQTSDEEVEEFSGSGQLIGADVASQNFHMKLDGGAEVRGKLALDVGDEKTLELPRRYRAKFRKTTTISYATEEERTTYYLIELDDN